MKKKEENEKEHAYKNTMYYLKLNICKYFYQIASTLFAI